MRDLEPVEREYLVLHRELAELRMRLGVKPWEPAPHSPQFRNPHPPGSPAYLQLAEVAAHYAELERRRVALAGELAVLRQADIEASLARSRARRGEA